MRNTLFIFDIDGTLLDSVGVHQKAFLKAVESFSFSKVNTNWSGYLHHTDSWIFSEIFRSNVGRLPSREDMNEFEQRLLKTFRGDSETANLKEIEGSLQFLATLEASQIPYSFATGGMLSVTNEKLNFLGPKSSFVPLVTASQHVKREDIVSNAAKLAEVKFEQSFDRFISIGDGVWDALTAKNLSYDFYGIQPFPEKLKEHCQANRIFPNFKELRLDSFL